MIRSRRNRTVNPEASVGTSPPDARRSGASCGCRCARDHTDGGPHVRELSEGDRCTITVNNREIQVYGGLTILQALVTEGIEVPSLCHDIRLERSNGNCGLCVVEVGADAPRDVKACLTPVQAGMVVTTHSPRLEAYRKVRLEQLLCDHNADCVAPCVETCPANIDIQTYLSHVADGNYEAAVRVIKDRNPFPSVCGRVCPHPCEAECRRGLVDEPIAINHVKRFAADGDRAQADPWRARPMLIDGESQEGVTLGIWYLRHVTKGVDKPLGDKVVVIGGGNTAIDCVRTALRKGAKHVKLVYRRTRDEMPAQSFEVEEALHEGVEMVFLTAPTRITSEGGVKQLHCVRMELGEPDRSGRRRPVMLEGSDFVIEADTIIGAIGQTTDTTFLYNDLPVRLNKWGDIDINGHTMQTSESNIFSGGDCVTGPATVIQAVAAGRRAAKAIDEFVTRGYVRPSQEDFTCSRGRLQVKSSWLG